MVKPTRILQKNKQTKNEPTNLARTTQNLSTPRSPCPSVAIVPMDGPAIVEARRETLNGSNGLAHNKASGIPRNNDADFDPTAAVLVGAPR